MGRRGPQPMPTKLKLLHGERRKSRVNRNEPQPRQALPQRPVGLTKRAAAVWRRVLRDYGATGVITAADRDALRAYCEAVARYEQAAAQLEREGPIVTGARSGDRVKNPLHQIVRDNANLMRQFARELGLTPSARTGLHVSAQEDGDAFAAWAGGAEVAE